MPDFTKYAYEEVFRYYDFERSDSLDGLADGETLSSVTVTCKDTAGNDCTSAMISNSAVVSSSAKAVYKLKAGTAGTSYIIYVKGVTSEGQKMEGRVTVDVV